MTNGTVHFGVIGAEHAHVYGISDSLIAAGAVCEGWWTAGEPETANGTIKPFPGIARVADYHELLDNPAIDLVVIATVPHSRAGIAVEALERGKDVVSDKPGVTTLDDLARLRSAIERTGRLWNVNFSERYGVRASLKASELVGQGMIGRVVQTIGLGPHRGLVSTRRPWFFKRDQAGGILSDMGAHQIDSFIHYTGSSRIDVVNATVANFTQPDLPEYEDFGEALLRGDGGLGYVRVDWLTPDTQPNPGDSRLTILGESGTIEIRKYVDIAGRAGRDHLFLIKGGDAVYIDCSEVVLRFFDDLVADVRDGGRSAEPAGHSLLVSEVAIKAQNAAMRLGHLSH